VNTKQKRWAHCSNCEALEYVECGKPWTCPYCATENVAPQVPEPNEILGDSTWACLNCHLDCNDDLDLWCDTCCERWMRNNGDDSTPLTIEEAIIKFGW